MDEKYSNAIFAFEGESEGAMALRYHRLLDALEMLHIMLIETDRDGAVHFANKAAEAYLDGISGSLAEEGFKRYLLDFPAEAAGFPESAEFCDPGRNIWFRVTSNTVLDKNDPGAVYLHIIEDINNWKLHESELKVSATFDELTGVYNRKTGFGFLGALLADKKSDATHCIAFLDMDDLKMINDRFGHHEGDMAIKAIAEVLLSSVRESDAVFRYGGDEFVVVFTKCSEERASYIMERMLNRLVIMDIENPKPYKLRFSYGVVAFRADEFKTAQELIALSDKKMYHDKVNNKLNRKANR